MKTQMHWRDGAYHGSDGSQMKREDGETPNGNPVNDRWVLRDPQGQWIDCNKYRHDLAGRYGIDLISGE